VVVIGLLIVGVLVVFDIGLLLEDDIGGSLEEVRTDVFFVRQTDVHAALVLYHLLLQQVVQTQLVLVLLQVLVLRCRYLLFLRYSRITTLLIRLRLLGVADDSRRAWPKITT
jgi:hypothetical protein